GNTLASHWLAYPRTPSCPREGRGAEQGWGEGLLPLPLPLLLFLAKSCPHPPFGHLLPQAGEGQGSRRAPPPAAPPPSHTPPRQTDTAPARRWRRTPPPARAAGR